MIPYTPSVDPIYPYIPLLPRGISNIVHGIFKRFDSNGLCLVAAYRTGSLLETLPSGTRQYIVDSKLQDLRIPTTQVPCKIVWPFNLDINHHQEHECLNMNVCQIITSRHKFKTQMTLIPRLQTWQYPLMKCKLQIFSQNLIALGLLAIDKR